MAAFCGTAKPIAAFPASPARLPAPAGMGRAFLACAMGTARRRRLAVEVNQRKILRCAVYARKSSEHGLEQDFNSLDAQREAAEAYIKSQAHEGWQLIKTHYADRGLSGGTLERPALQMLLSDIRARKIDVVVVYKVDRLTRSLAHFAKLVELFEAHGVSFVSVTQQFNTTTSMGRLTLNVLLSFAQFEREIAGERIRDKFAASRRKGMWMGGTIPLGYDVKDRKLIVNAAEAETVRLIFERYLALGCVSKVKVDLDQKGIRRKKRILTSGRALGNAVQTMLSANLTERRQARIASGALLAGLIFDDRGHRMSPTYTVRRRNRYRYYVSQAQLRGGEPGSRPRIGADEVEQLVVQAVCRRRGDEHQMAAWSV